jgi:hypothetical protein
MEIGYGNCRGVNRSYDLYKKPNPPSVQIPKGYHIKSYVSKQN